MSDQSEKSSPSPRIYLAKRHRAWFYGIPRFERSKIVNAALDVYRAKKEAKQKIDSQIDSPAADQGKSTAGDKAQ